MALTVAVRVRRGGRAAPPGREVVVGGPVGRDGVPEEEVRDVGAVAVGGELVAEELGVGEAVAEDVGEEEDGGVGVGGGGGGWRGRGGGGGVGGVGFDFWGGGVG